VPFSPGPEHETHGEIVVLAPAQRASLDLSVTAVQHGRLTDTLRFPSEIEFDPMRVAHLTPRVAGMVKEVHFRLGDSVKKGEVLAVLESRDLGKAKSDYLAALARQDLHEKIYAREKGLWEKGVSAEQEFLEAELDWAEARIRVRQARESLYSLGVDEESLEALSNESQIALNRYRMTMPFAGTIIRQHITLGEMLTEGSAAFVVADTSRVWVMAQVSERDLNAIRPGQIGVMSFNGLPNRGFRGVVDFISSEIDRETRTARMCLVLDNPGGMLRAGMFGQTSVLVPNEKEAETFLVPKAALQRMAHGPVAFREIEPGRYEMVAVAIVVASEEFAEVTGPLQPGDRLVTGDTFILKSQAGKAGMASGHHH